MYNIDFSSILYLHGASVECGTARVGSPGTAIVNLKLPLDSIQHERDERVSVSSEHQLQEYLENLNVDM